MIRETVCSVRRFNLMLVAVASVVLMLMLVRVDWPGLMHSMSQVGPYWPLLIVPYGLTCLFWTLSWRFLLVGTAAPSVARLFSLRLAGESLNQLTPTASIGGEPFKALRLQAGGVPWQEATASLVIHKAMMVTGLVLYVLLALALIPFTLPGISRTLAIPSYLGTLLLAGAAGVFILVQRRNPCTLLVRALQRFGLCPAVLVAKKEQLASLDAHLERFYREHPGLGLMSLLFFFLGWLVHAAEVYLIFRLLGHPITFATALCLDALSQLVAGLGFMIPASLGVQDGGNILLSLGFNLGATLGAGFGILRRFREAFWLLLGLVTAARENRR
jgi:uncharacterized protein (TIRG00374 family)